MTSMVRTLPKNELLFSCIWRYKNIFTIKGKALNVLIANEVFQINRPRWLKMIKAISTRSSFYFLSVCEIFLSTCIFSTIYRTVLIRLKKIQKKSTQKIVKLPRLGNFWARNFLFFKKFRLFVKIAKIAKMLIPNNFSTETWKFAESW